ncbi:Permease [Deinococcus saxicola]|uniref:hypothetical protein n=1 Tax=Deinococcus saxicola TaxID=249406 RepID=UPI0039EF1BB7
MVQSAVQSLRSALEGLLGLALPAAIVLAALLLALLLIGLLDRARFQAGLNGLAAHGAALGRWALAGLALGAGLLALDVARRAVDIRLGTQQNARYANAADPDGGQTVQSAPRVTLLQDTTYTRSLSLPPEVFARISVQGGLEPLLPYFGSPDSAGIRDFRENFVRRGNTLVYTREVTLQTEQPVNVDTTRITTDLKFVDPAGGRGTYYNAVFNADYTFANPLKTVATLRFDFPLPSGSGTLSNFRLTVGGQEFRAGDLTDGSQWEGEVAAGATVKVNVTYRNQGARSWSYALGSRREAIRAFDLSVNADRPAKFGRYTLFPTFQARTPLGEVRSLRWQLQDVISAQDVSVIFAGGNRRETLGKVGHAAPVAVLLAALLALAWATTRRLRLPPLPLAAALLGLSLGLVLGGVLTAYLPIWLAEILGVMAGVALGILALGRPFALPLILAGVVPLAFLSGGHAGLLLTLLAALILTLLLRPGLERWGRKRAAF